MISDLLCLDADPGLFVEKTMDDISFIDNVLSALMKCLIDNSSLLDRNEELSKLADLEWRFDQLLNGIHGNSGIINALNLGENLGKTAIFKNNSIQRRMTIENSHSASSQNMSEPVVSSYELNQLLQAF